MGRLASRNTYEITELLVYLSTSAPPAQVHVLGDKSPSADNMGQTLFLSYSPLGMLYNYLLAGNQATFFFMSSWCAFLAALKRE